MLKKQYLYILILNCIYLFIPNSNAAEFQNLTGKAFSYIFAPGIISIETQTAKYIPELVGSSGETVVCNGGIHTLNSPISTCMFSEISNQPLSTQSINPFVHLGYWITDKLNKKYGVTVRKSNQGATDQSAPNSVASGFTVEKHAFDFTKINLAQEADINALLKTYTEHTQKYPDTDIIVYGVSRGAATICTFMAKHQPKNVKGLVLEAPFDSFPHLLRHSHTTLHRIINKVAPKLISYDPNGDSPIKSIENISKDIPILIVASQIDDVIPVQCSESLMRKFVKTGHHKVHLLRLKNSTHSGYAFDDNADKLKYQSVVHAFYKHYGLPYDANLALQGDEEWKKICH